MFLSSKTSFVFHSDATVQMNGFYLTLQASTQSADASGVSGGVE
jgi:hypothetical protein